MGPTHSAESGRYSPFTIQERDGAMGNWGEMIKWTLKIQQPGVLSGKTENGFKNGHMGA